MCRKVWAAPTLRRTVQMACLAVWLLPCLGRAEDVRDEAYHLAAGDRITVTVFGQPELSGDTLIDNAGTITIPLLDPIKIKDLTLAECQKRILDRLADGILQKPSVSVRIAELRPLSVLGDVRTPGAYPFRYGSTVETAVALAGGYGPGEAVRQTAVSEYLAADERVRQLSVQERILLVRRVRLQAEADGNDTFSPPAVADGSRTEDMMKIVQNEKDILSARRSIIQGQIKLLGSQKPHLEDQITANTEQSNAERKQLDIVRQQAESYDKLVKQGLGTTNNNFQYHMLESTQSASIWRLLADVSRLQMQSGDLDLKIQEVEAAFKREVAKELQDVSDRLGELDVTLPAAIRMRDIRFRYAGGTAAEGVRHSIRITRMRDGHAVALDADEVTPLEPGDVIDVKNDMPQIMQHDDAAAEPPMHSRDKRESKAAEIVSEIAR